MNPDTSELAPFYTILRVRALPGHLELLLRDNDTGALRYYLTN